MRPWAIVGFEIGTGVILALGSIQLFIALRMLGVPPDLIVGNLLSSAWFFVLLVLFSLRRSKIAMWLFILTMLPSGSLNLWYIWQEPLSLLSLASLGETVVQFALIALLLTPDARRWINRQDDHLGEVF